MCTTSNTKRLKSQNTESQIFLGFISCKYRPKPTGKWLVYCSQSSFLTINEIFKKGSFLQILCTTSNTKRLKSQNTESQIFLGFYSCKYNLNLQENDWSIAANSISWLEMRFSKRVVYCNYCAQHQTQNG